MKKIILPVLIIFSVANGLWAEVIEGQIQSVISYKSIRVQHSGGSEEFELFMPGGEPRGPMAKIDIKTQLNNLMLKTIYLEVKGKNNRGIRKVQIIEKPAPAPPSQVNQPGKADSVQTPAPAHKSLISNPQQQHKKDMARQQKIRDDESAKKEKEFKEIESKIPVYMKIFSIVMLFVLAYFGIVKKIRIWDLFK